MCVVVVSCVCDFLCGCVWLDLVVYGFLMLCV